MAIYLGLLLLTVIFGSFCGRSRGNSFIWCTIILLCWSLPAILRYGVGTDYLGTYTFLIAEAMDGECTTGIGYYLLERLMLWVSDDNGYFVFGGAAVLIYSLVLLAMPRRRFLATTVWFFLTLYTFTFNGIRQSVALAWILLAFANLQRKRYLPAIILMAVAVSFHSSALVGVVMMFAGITVAKHNLGGKTHDFAIVAFMMLMAAFAGSFLLKHLIPEDSRYLEYLMNEEFSEPVTLKLRVLEMIYVAISTTLAIFLWQDSKSCFRYRLLSCLCIMAASVRVASLGWEILRRFPYLTDFPLPFAIAAVRLRRYPRRFWIIVAFYMVWGAIFIYSLIPKENGHCWHDAVPYRTFFDVAHPKWELLR